MDSEDDIFITQSTFKETEEDDFQYRFGEPLSSEDIEKKLKVCVPKSTRYRNNWGVSVFSRWQEERRSRPIQDNLELPAGCLNTHLLKMNKEYLNIALKYFIFEVRKQNGSEYPANSVYALYTAIQSSLRENGTVINLFDDEEFIGARKCLDAAMRNLSKKGLGSSSRKLTETISSDEEELLWMNGSLGEDSPRKLLDTILYLTGLNFALRGGKEHRSLRLFSMPQITGPHVDEKGRRYLLYKEDVSKTNHGGIKDRKVSPKEVRAYENAQPSRCYVRLFEKYRSLCSDGKDTDYFYFNPMVNYRPQKWFTRLPVGHNSLQSTIKRLCKTSGIPGSKTNHSLRATAATRLFQANVEEQLICEVTGHRSDAVRTYKRTSSDQKQNVSEILTKVARTSTTEDTPTVQNTATTTTSTSTSESLNADVTGNKSATYNFYFH